MVVIKEWGRRHISLFGKSLVAKSFMLSKINHILQSLALPNSVLDIIDSLIFQFLWMKTDLGKRATEKVKRNVLCLPIAEGGLNMISVRDQQEVMCLRWLKRGCIANFSMHNTLIHQFFKHIGGIEYCLLCNIDIKYFKGFNEIKSLFWRKALSAWLRLDKTIYNSDPKKIPLFNNSSILYKKSPLLIYKWIKNDMLYYHQMINEFSQIKSLGEISTHIKPSGGLHLDYLAVKNAIIHFHAHQSQTDSPHHKPDLMSIFMANNRLLRYAVVKQNQTENSLHCVDFWYRKLQIDITIYFKMAIETTTEMKLRSLHFKLVHNIYPNNVLLHKMKIKDSIYCDHCNEVDFTDHMFVKCHRLQSYWSYVNDQIDLVLEKHIELDVTMKLFGLLECKWGRKRANEANYIILLAKFCLVKSKYDPSRDAKHIFEIELKIRDKYLPLLHSNKLLIFQIGETGSQIDDGELASPASTGCGNGSPALTDACGLHA